jgi:hypothetical protein
MMVLSARTRVPDTFVGPVDAGVLIDVMARMVEGARVC